jgi:hypothetical protein
MFTAENTITDWLQLIRGEYLESPGLILTKPQVQRLWGLDPATCDAVLDTLVRTKFLRRTLNHAYARADISR